MGRNLMLACALITVSIAAQGDDGAKKPLDAAAVNEEFARWVFPGSKTAFQASHTTAIGQVVRVTRTEGEYTTEVPFDEVVRFYVDRSGFEPPNWSILGRKFPGDRINIPGFWSAEMDEGKTVSIQHHIRPDAAVLMLLLDDLEGRRTTAVTVSRGLQDAKTYIQVARHWRDTHKNLPGQPVP